MAQPLAARTHHVDLRDAAGFVNEYKANLCHGSMVAPWLQPPGMGKTVPIVVDLPAGFPSMNLRATVVMPTAGLVVLQVQLEDTDRDALRACAEACGYKAEAPAPALSPVARAAPPPAAPPRPDEGASAVNLWPELAELMSVGAPPEPEHPGSQEGELEQTPAEELLLALGRSGATGKLTIGDNQQSTEIFLDHGAIVAAVDRPERPNRRLGDMLVRTGKVKPRDRDLALQQSQKEGAPLGEVLVKRGFVAGPVLRQALEAQLLARTSEQLRRRTGHYTFTEGARPRRRSGLPPMPAAAAIFRCKVDTFMQRTPQEAEEAEAEIFWLYVYRAPDAPTTPEALSKRGLDRDEQRFWDLVITGQYTERELYAVSDLGKRRTHAVVMALLDVGLATLEKHMHPTFRLAKLREELNHKLRQVGGGSHFDVLDLHWMADTRDVEEGYRKVVNAFGLHELDMEIPADVKRMSDEVLERASEARLALLHPRDRAEYRRTILEQAQIDNALEILVRQGSIDYYRGALRDAEYRYAHIIELDPYNADAKRTLTAIRARQAHIDAGEPDPEARPDHLPFSDRER